MCYSTCVLIRALFLLVCGICIIKPIPKSSSLDPTDPLSYGGISLASAVYKIYCRIINSRLSDWVEKNNVLVDEQNRFRRKRGTIDHISSLVDIVETRLRFKQSTFAAFIDFRKAYDLIYRDKLWERLKTYGVSGNLMKAIKSLYASVSSCVRVNSHQVLKLIVACDRVVSYRRFCLIFTAMIWPYI